MITEANGNEIYATEFLFGLVARMVNGKKDLEERLRGIPNGIEDYDNIISTLDKLLGAILDTMPEKTVQHMEMICKCGQVIIRPKPMIKMPDDVHIVNKDDLKVLINMVVEHECAMCLRNEKEQRRCKLRRAMHHIAPTEAIHKDDKCSYLDVATGNPLGEYM